MEDCSKRAEALCELNLKGFAPESRVNAIKSAVGIVCLAVVTVALLAWMDFAQPKESAGQEGSGVVMVNFVSLLSRWPWLPFR